MEPMTILEFMSAFYDRILSRDYDWTNEESQMQLLVDYARIGASMYKLRSEINREDRQKLLKLFQEEILRQYPDCDFFHTIES